MHTDGRPTWTPSPPRWRHSDDGLRDRVTTLEFRHQAHVDATHEAMTGHDGRIGKIETRMKSAADYLRYGAGAWLLYLVGAGKMTVSEVLSILKALADLLRALGGK